MREQELVRSILQWLSYKRIFAWRQNSGAFKTERGNFYRMGINGAPDIFILKDGIIYACECKVGKNKQNENQIQFQKDFEKNGGKYFVARQLDDIIKILV